MHYSENEENGQENSMTNTVFVLGAGASKLAGAPLMKEFLDTSHELWSLNAVGDAQDDFKTVFDARAALQAVHSKSQLDIDNIESLFSAIEMAKTLGRFPGKSEAAIDDLIRALKVVIVKTLESTVKLPVQSGELASPPPFQEFVNLVQHLQDQSQPRHSVSVITFNYDLALDAALALNAYRANYGLKTQVEVAGKPFPLFKLHGSLNWTEPIPTAKDKGIVAWGLGHYLAMTKASTFISQSDKAVVLPLGTQLKELSSRPELQGSNILVTGEPVLVPPTWNKTESHRTLATVWRQAAEALAHAENIFVVGYSMPETDAFFRYLYALGTVGTAMLKRFWVFDIDTTTVVKKRYEDLLGPGAKARFKYFEDTFAHAISTVRGTFPVRRTSPGGAEQV